jgi:hypothetical protein
MAILLVLHAEVKPGKKTYLTSAHRWKEGKKRERERERERVREKRKNAPAGNRTRVCTVAGYYSTTRPLAPLMK